ncbi:hypothetical protein SAMN04488023_101250 [Pedobacter rhizosphaerae]|uniref:Uncharacterized protein n=1 Tax=Pedobacter rhizosphaerae TaxID=390241 RepID=A0A1H9J820_9SPHI|nr:hypothetical protein SAMN04488023_101250 [Pedobacter rhizosphaerae]
MAGMPASLTSYPISIHHPRHEAHNTYTFLYALHGKKLTKKLLPYKPCKLI